MIDLGGMWGIVTILGPILLGAAMIYGLLMVRKRGRATKNLTEQTTRELYRRGAERERTES
jgi:hypothetical protein